MKVLYSIVLYGHAKNYVVPKWIEMANECIFPVNGVDLIIGADSPRDEFPGHNFVPLRPGLTYVEDMLIPLREKFREMAIYGEYDKLVWGGIDCLFQTRSDFERLINHDVDAVAPLISARTDPNAPVARRFEQNHYDGWFSEEQYDIHDWELLRSKELILSGFPGADAYVVDKKLFGITYDGHIPWYQRVANGQPNLDCMEYWTLMALNRGAKIYVDPLVKVWHVNEDGWAHMYKGIRKRMEELTW